MTLKPKLAAFFLSTFAICFTAGAFANRIDSLQTDADVSNFVKSVNKDFNTGTFELRDTETLRKNLDCDGMAAKWQIKNWEKVDLNNDKLTDLVIMPFWYDYGVYVIMDKGNNVFETFTLTYNIFEKCELAKPVELASGNGLLYFQRNSKLKTQTDTLVYRNGGFVEYNSQAGTVTVDSISFKAGPCFGSCPVFEIRTDKNGNAVYEAGQYNPKMGKFTGTIQAEEMKDILELVSYMDPQKLKDDYKVSWKDDQTAWLRIRFSDGTVKEVRDYGLKGSFGLRLLYNKFFSLRRSQTWK